MTIGCVIYEYKIYCFHLDKLDDPKSELPNSVLYILLSRVISDFLIFWPFLSTIFLLDSNFVLSNWNVLNDY